MYQYYKERIGVCDAEIEKQLQQYEASRNEGLIEAPKSDAKDLTRIKKTKDKNHPSFDVRGYLQRIHGVDVLNIYGFSETGGLEVLAETGTNMSKWKNDNHFVSWFNLCPNNKISGGKLISSMLLKKKPNPRQPCVQGSS